MKIWRDTLAKRLFVLMWVALVAANVLAWSVFSWMHDGLLNPGPLASMRSLTPSLPPTPGLNPMHGPGPDEHPGPDHPPPDGPMGNEGPPGSPPDADRPPHSFGSPGQPGPSMAAHMPPPHGFGLTPGSLLLDYGLRMLVIALAAWWGSRWLAGPMRRLVGAAEQLRSHLSGDTPTHPQLNEDNGTLEVREAAQVFNGMAADISRLFDERGLMLAALSHDLRTPLTRLRLRLEAIDAPDVWRERAAADIAAMDALIREVLDLFRGASNEAMQEVDVAALVQALADDLIEQGQALNCRLPERTIARAQPAALRRIIDNLVGNALRYGKEVEIDLMPDGAQLLLRIADRGPGIAPELLEQVFQPFFRVEASRNRSGGGTGLGLFIARDLARRMGARLALANREGGGLVASLALPRH